MTDQEKLKRLRHKLEKKSFVEDKYNEESWINDQRFGKVLIWSQKSGDTLSIMKKRTSKTGEDCVKDVQHARERLKLNQNYIMRMLDYSVRVNSLEQFEVWGFYEAPLQDLSKEIQNRILKKK